MSYRLPITNHPLREAFDVRDLVAIGTGEQTPPTFPEARAAARRTFEGNDAVRAVNCICMRACGGLHLVRFGPRGGHKTLWRFS